MKISSSIVKTIGCLFVAGSVSAPALAEKVNVAASNASIGGECTYQQAQNSMLQFNNIMQNLNMEVVKRQASGEPIPSSLREKLTRMIDDSTPLNEMMGDLPSLDTIDTTTAVDTAICQGYESLIKTYGGTSDAVQVKAHKNPECDQSSLWTRYMDAMQTVTSAFQKQKITSEEVDQFRVMDVQIGQYSTTNLSKACEVLSEYESRVNSIQ